MSTTGHLSVQTRRFVPFACKRADPMGHFCLCLLALLSSREGLWLPEATRPPAGDQARGTPDTSGSHAADDADRPTQCQPRQQQGESSDALTRAGSGSSLRVRPVLDATGVADH